MPFYGRAVLTTFFYGQIKRITMSANNVTVEHKIACDQSPYETPELVIENIPSGAFLSFTGDAFCLGGFPLEASLKLQQLDNPRNYGLYFANNKDWYPCGNLWLYETQPIICNGLSYCDYSSHYLLFENINGTTYNIPGTSETVNACTTSVNGSGIQAGGMKMIPWHLLTNDNWELYPCFNPTANYVQFPFTINGLNSITFRYLTGLCDLGTSGRVFVDNSDEFRNLLNSTPESEYCNIWRDVCGHFGSDHIESNYVILSAVVMEHEHMHFDNYYNLYYLKYFKELENSLRNIGFSCEVYSNMDPEEAVIEMKKRIKNTIKAYVGTIETMLNQYGRAKIDEEINTNKKIHDAIQPYYDIIEQRAKSICPIHPLCDKFKNAKF